MEVELVAQQGYLHSFAESCDQMVPLLQGGSGDRVEGNNKVLLGFSTFHLLPGVRLEILYVSGQQ